MAMGVPDGGFPPAKLRSFTNRTMQDNWWEDREQEEYYKKHPLDTSCMVRAAPPMQDDAHWSSRFRVRASGG